jgi:hypothetical protein
MSSPSDSSAYKPPNDDDSLSISEDMPLKERRRTKMKVLRKKRGNQKKALNSPSLSLKKKKERFSIKSSLSPSVLGKKTFMSSQSTKTKKVLQHPYKTHGREPTILGKSTPSTSEHPLRKTLDYAFKSSSIKNANMNAKRKTNDDFLFSDDSTSTHRTEMEKQKVSETPMMQSWKKKKIMSRQSVQRNSEIGSVGKLMTLNQTMCRRLTNI